MRKGDGKDVGPYPHEHDSEGIGKCVACVSGGQKDGFRNDGPCAAEADDKVVPLPHPIYHSSCMSTPGGVEDQKVIAGYKCFVSDQCGPASNVDLWMS